MQQLHKGFYKAHGRTDDTMNLGGIKVGALELEAALDGHPAVAESAAGAVQPGGEGAERLVVYVTLKQEVSSEELLPDLRKRIAQQVNPLFKIHDVVVKEALSRTASNKLLRRELRNEYLRDM